MFEPCMLVILFYISAAIICLYWIFGYTKMIFYRDQKQNEVNWPPVSVVLSAHNEAHNLRAKLPAILSQDYPEFEVIVVNDCSTDETGEVLRKLSLKYSRLRGVHKESKEKGKKQALDQGIQSTQYDLVLVTDADCEPHSNLWIEGMVRANQGHELTLGYGPMMKSQGLVNQFSRFETIMTAIQYFSWALAGVPYMGVGRNMMYQKKLFQSAGGFEKHQDLISGDDDLFVQEVGGKASTSITLNSETFMYSESKRDWRSFFRQKSRHVSTSVRYRTIHKVGLTMFSVAQMCFYPFLILLLWRCPQPGVLPVASMVVFIKWALFSPVVKKLKEQDLFFWFIPLDVMYSVYLWALLPMLFVGKTKSWK